MFQIPFGAERKFQCNVSILCAILREEQGRWMILYLSLSP